MSERKTYRILVVDDDRDILDLLKYNLVREDFKVKTIEQSTEAIKTAISFKPDLIILDIMMPGINGIEICKELRRLAQFKDTFIFFLTAKSESYFEAAALDTGGDDFIEKIVGLRILTQKIKNVLRKRIVIRKCIEEIKIGSFSINRKKGTVVIDNAEVSLSKAELELLFFFAQNPRKVIANESIQESLLVHDALNNEKTIESYIGNLANKLGRQLIMKVTEGKYRLNLRF